MNVTNEMMAEVMEIRRKWVRDWSAIHKVKFTQGESDKTPTTCFPPYHWQYDKPIPDYTSDLNLVHEIEATLTDAEILVYIEELGKPEVSIGYCHTMPRDVILTAIIGGVGYTFKNICHATAQQKCDVLYPILKARTE